MLSGDQNIVNVVFSVAYEVADPMLYLFRIIKRLFGFADFTDDDDSYDEWTSADQLSHYSGETVDSQQGQWRKETWPGNATGRGQSQLDQWQRPNSSGWHQQWTRRGAVLLSALLLLTLLLSLLHAW